MTNLSQSQHIIDLIKRNTKVAPAPSVSPEKKQQQKQDNIAKKIQKLTESVQIRSHYVPPVTQPKKQYIVKHIKETDNPPPNNFETLLLTTNICNDKTLEEKQELLDQLWVDFVRDNIAEQHDKNHLALVNDIASLSFVLQDFEKSAIAYSIITKYALQDEHLLSRLAFCYYHSQNYQEAAEYYKQLCILTNYKNHHHQLSLASSFIEMEKHKEAIGVFNSMIKRFPHHEEGYVHKSGCLLKMNYPEQALQTIEKALEYCEKSSIIYMQQGLVYKELKQYEHGITSFSKALELDHNNENLWGHRATLKNAIGDEKGALSDYYQALKYAPHKISIAFNTGWQLLRLGHWREGLKLYSTRMRRGDFRKLHHMPKNIPLWNGEILEGKSLLLHSEQGYGDTIMSLRYCSEIRKFHPKSIIIETNDPLHDLIKYNEFADIVINEDMRDTIDFDYHLPLMELLRIFDCQTNHIIKPEGYLKPPTDNRLKLKRTSDHVPIVAIIWKGSPLFPNNHERSITLETLKPLFDIEGCQFVSMQRGQDVEDITTLGLRKKISNIGNISRDFYDSSAILTQCDLLISTCTGPVHLAGALGVKTWVLLHHHCDWRWSARYKEQENIYTYWYDSVEILQNSIHSPWETIIPSLCQKLSNFVTEFQKNMKNNSSLLLVILAGGQARRMNFVNKAHQYYKGKKLLDYVLQAVPYRDTAINIRRDDTYDYSYPTFTDNIVDYAGPLAGMEAGLSYACTQQFSQVLFVACDCPYYPSNLIEKMCYTSVNGRYIVMAKSFNRIHPVISLWPVHYLKKLQKFLEQGERKIDKFITQYPYKIADFTPVEDDIIDPFVNINRLP